MKSLDRNETRTAESPPQAGNPHDQLGTDQQESPKPDGQGEANPPALSNPSKSPLQMSRRAFIAAGVVAPLLVPRHVLGGAGYQAPSDKLRIACVGVGGVGED
jgi:hypothetical protein